MSPQSSPKVSSDLNEVEPPLKRVRQDSPEACSSSSSETLPTRSEQELIQIVRYPYIPDSSVGSIADSAQSSDPGQPHDSQEKASGPDQRFLQLVSEISSDSASLHDTPAASPSSKASDEESSDSDSGSEVTMPTTVFGVRDWLESKRLLIDDKDAGLTGENLIKSAMKIIDNKRGSDWSDEKSREVEEELEAFRGHPETTFVFVLISHLLGKTRMVPKDKVMTAEDVTEATEWIERAWRKDNICPRMNYDFDKNCIPNIRTGDKHLDAMIDEIPRLETPRPDVIWALRKEAFSVKHRHILKNQNCALAGPGLFDVFFVLEAKCMNASLEEAENQCMRSGSAIVATRRRLQDAAAVCEPKVVTAASTTEKAQNAVNQKDASSQQGYPRPDMRSFAFSLAVGPEDARLFVNWAMELNPEGGVDWHMHHLRKFDFRSRPSLTQLHHDIDNILDWGAEKGTRKVTELCTTLEEYEAMAPQPPSKKRKTQA